MLMLCRCYVDVAAKYASMLLLLCSSRLAAAVCSDAATADGSTLVMRTMVSFPGASVLMADSRAKAPAYLLS